MDKFLEQWDIDIDDPDKDKHQLFDALRHKLKEAPHNVELFWRLVQASLVLASSYEKNDDKVEGKKYTEESVKWAKKAVEYGPNSMQAHKWYCAAVGRMAAYAPTKEKIQLGHEFKEHRDIAVRIDPNDRLMHHMYGRWCFEIASLSWIERKVATAFFGAPPEATYQDALDSFHKADNLKHDWVGNQCFIAKTYIAMKQYSHAIKWIDSGLALPVVTEDDSVMHNDLKELQKSYAKYRS